MSLEITAKRLAAPLAVWTGRRLARGDAVVAPILCYHGIACEAALEHVGAANFTEQMRAVAAGGRCRPLGEIVDSVVSGVEQSAGIEPGLALTFDDGYASLLEHAVPVLRALSLSATVFVVPGKLGRIADWPSPASAVERRLVSLGEVEKLRAAGLTVGAHGWTHIDLTTCSAQQRSDEIRRCFEFLTIRLGVGRPVFCYPWGRFDEEVMAEVGRAGFVAAVAGGWGQRHRRADLFNLRRVAIDWTDTIRDFNWKLRGGYGWWTSSWWHELRDFRKSR